MAEEERPLFILSGKLVVIITHSFVYCGWSYLLVEIIKEIAAIFIIQNFYCECIFPPLFSDSVPRFLRHNLPCIRRRMWVGDEELWHFNQPDGMKNCESE